MATASETVGLLLEKWEAEKRNLPMRKDVIEAIDKHLQRLQDRRRSIGVSAVCAGHEADKGLDLRVKLIAAMRSLGDAKSVVLCIRIVCSPFKVDHGAADPMRDQIIESDTHTSGGLFPSKGKRHEGFAFSRYASIAG